MNTRGAIGLARSDDLDRWTLQPPVYAGGHYGQLEVPQVFELGGRWYMVFCNAGDHWSRAVVDEHAAAGHGGPQWGSHYLMAEHPLGPWRLPGTAFLDGAMPCARYAAKVIQSGNGPVLMGFLYWGSQGESNGRFIGELCDPVPVRVDAVTGQLRIGSSADV
jgi:beta-fructofuranosidase